MQVRKRIHGSGLDHGRSTRPVAVRPKGNLKTGSSFSPSRCSKASSALALENLLLAELKKSEIHQLGDLFSTFGPDSSHRNTREQVYQAIRDVGAHRRIMIGEKAWKGFYEETDWNSGVNTGRLISFQHIHNEGSSHVAVHLALVTHDRRIIVQKTRKQGGEIIEWSAAGHLEPGTSVIESALDEGNEELLLKKIGIQLDSRQLKTVSALDGRDFMRRIEKKALEQVAGFDADGVAHVKGLWPHNSEQVYLVRALLNREQTSDIERYFQGHQSEEVQGIEILSLEKLTELFGHPADSPYVQTSGLFLCFHNARVRAHVIRQIES